MKQNTFQDKDTDIKRQMISVGDAIIFIRMQELYKRVLQSHTVITDWCQIGSGWKNASCEFL